MRLSLIAVSATLVAIGGLSGCVYITADEDAGRRGAAVEPGGSDTAGVEADGGTDDGDCDPDLDGVQAPGAWYADSDGDGYGDPAAATVACEAPAGSVADDTDCDDGDPAIHPGADEPDCVDPVDYNCDGWTGQSDVDGDGVVACTDCDDFDALVFPGAAEVCDEVDNNCDGAVDDDDADLDLGSAIAWYADADGDGYGDATAATWACVEPIGSVGDATDCDDANEAANPAAVEECNDLDDDCDGAIDDDDDSLDGTTGTLFYTDADGDGYGYGTAGTGAWRCDQLAATSMNYMDCDDADAAVNPAATEVCGDGVDNDCDDSAGRCALSGSVASTSAVLSAEGDASGDRAGYAVAGPGDVDGDGIADMLIGAPKQDTVGGDAGASYLVLGGSSGTFGLSSSHARLLGEDGGDYAGWAVGAPGDVDGDGYADLLVGAPEEGTVGGSAGAAYLVLGPVSGDLALGSADGRWLGRSGSERAGFSLAGAGDVDGDGTPDIIVGGPQSDAGVADAGAVYLLFGPATWAGSLNLADATLTGAAQDDGAGTSVAGPGDVNGDGFDDLLVGAPYECTEAAAAGAAYLVLGPTSGTASLSGADGVWLGQSSDANAGWSVSGAGDVDGDGKADVLVGAPLQSIGSLEKGRAYLLLGPATGSHGLGGADGVYSGTNANDLAGYAVTGAGDLDGDGLDDVLVGAQGRDGAISDGGVAYVLLGPATGTVALSAADAEIQGETSAGYLGSSLAGVGDVRGNGRAAFLVGAPEDDNRGDGAGAAYLFDNGW